VRRNKIAVGLVGVAVAIGGVATAGAGARPAATYKLSATKTGFKFNKSTLNVKAGRVTLSMANPSSIPHAVGIKGKGKGKTVGRNGTSSYSATLKKGRYTFYCPVGQHAANGMTGKLIVG
jgi:plastocyanin